MGWRAATEDRLLFDLQTAVALSLGLKSHTPPGRKLPGTRQRSAYAPLLLGGQSGDAAAANCAAQYPRRLHPARRPPAHQRLVCRQNGLLDVRDADLYQHQPLAILPSFLTLQTHPGLRDFFCPHPARAVQRPRPHGCHLAPRPGQPRHLYPHPAATQRHLAGAALDECHLGTGALFVVVSAHRRQDPQHDLFHVYTVDQHSLMVLRICAAFSCPSSRNEYPLCSELASQWAQPWLLYLAALFHDIGKGRGATTAPWGRLKCAALPASTKWPRRCRFGRVSGARTPAHEHRGAKARHQ